MNNVAIRPYKEDDHNFILNSWLNSFAQESAFSALIDRDLFFKFHSMAVKNILKRPSTTTLIATDTPDSDLIYGYAVYEQIPEYDIFHYIYVKRPFNNFGLAKLLTEKAPFDIKKKYASHSTRSGKKIIQDNKLKYCPYLI